MNNILVWVWAVAALFFFIAAILNANPDNRVIALQYLDALKQVANGQASKIFIPYEATAILGALGGIQEVLKDGTGSGLGGSPLAGTPTLVTGAIGAAGSSSVSPQPGAGPGAGTK